jgi:hypothetical protein
MVDASCECVVAARATFRSGRKPLRNWPEYGLKKLPGSGHDFAIALLAVARNAVLRLTEITPHSRPRTAPRQKDSRDTGRLFESGNLTASPRIVCI